MAAAVVSAINGALHIFVNKGPHSVRRVGAGRAAGCARRDAGEAAGQRYSRAAGGALPDGARGVVMNEGRTISFCAALNTLRGRAQLVAIPRRQRARVPVVVVFDLVERHAHDGAAGVDGECIEIDVPGCIAIAQRRHTEP